MASAEPQDPAPNTATRNVPFTGLSLRDSATMHEEDQGLLTLGIGMTLVVGGKLCGYDSILSLSALRINALLLAQFLHALSI